MLLKRNRRLPLQWRHNGRDVVSNHQPHDCLLNRLFRRRSKKTSKFRVTGLCAANSSVTGEFPAQMASNEENVSINDLPIPKNFIGGMHFRTFGQNVRRFADDIFKCIFVNEKFCILNKISLTFVSSGLIHNNPALVQIMAWRRIGDKPLSEPILPQFIEAYLRHQVGDELICHVVVVMDTHFLIMCQIYYFGMPNGPSKFSESGTQPTVACYRYATPFFIQRGHRRSLPILRKNFFLIWEESDGGHRIKRALYIGIKRLWHSLPFEHSLTHQLFA